MTLRDELRAAIEASGKSANQIAKESGIDQSTISRFLLGKNPTLDTVEKLAEYFGLALLPKQPQTKRRPRR